jgi:HlyD family secretion protein
MRPLLGRLVRTLLLAATVAAGGVAAFRWCAVSPGTAEPTFREASVTREDFRISMAGSGTLEPEEVVDVGAQVAGIVREFGRVPGTEKHIDYGSAVEPGSVLARIDDGLYLEEVELAKADLIRAQAGKRQAESGVLQAQANLQRAHADLQQLKARADQAERDGHRTEQLFARNSAVGQDVEAAQLAMVEAAAAVSIGEAAIRQAEAAVETARGAVVGADAAAQRAQAVLRKAETNLGYTTITSPIRGVIIDRRVNIGQTVVASLNAPSLFLIAKDLHRLQIWASVNEADIGSVRVGQRVLFTVDALVDREFVGSVSQIRLNASMIQNVVTYTVVIAVDNADGVLLPYMTTSLQFEVDVHDGVLLVPVAALRWKPQPAMVHPDVREAWLEEQEAEAGGEPRPRSQGTLWTADDGYVRPLSVVVGPSDWTRTEVAAPGLEPGMKVVVGEVRKAAAPAETVNPFTPKLTLPKAAAK